MSLSAGYRHFFLSMEFRMPRNLTRRNSRRRGATRKQRRGRRPNLIPLTVKFQNCTATPEYPLCNKADVQLKPTVTWQVPPPGKLYTFFAWDPDVPQKSWLHWLAVNCTASPATGQLIVDWAPPTPPSGVHRYIFAVAEQTKPISIPPPPGRGNFKIFRFVRKNGLRILSITGIKVKA